PLLSGSSGHLLRSLVLRNQHRQLRPLHALPHFVHRLFALAQHNAWTCHRAPPSALHDCRRRHCSRHPHGRHPASSGSTINRAAAISLSSTDGEESLSPGPEIAFSHHLTMAVEADRKSLRSCNILQLG